MRQIAGWTALLISLGANLAFAHPWKAAELGKTQDREALRAWVTDQWIKQNPRKAAEWRIRPERKVAAEEFVAHPMLPMDNAFLTLLTSQLVGPPAQTAPAGNGALMAASFAPFKPKVRFYWDATTFYEESDNMPDNMPDRMAGITAWQQQIPLPAAYFASVPNPENSTGSLGYGQPNYWRLPLVPTVAPSPTLIFTPGVTNNNFQRGAIALASNGIAIFNPANNTGRVSYEIGELDYYGGHCGLADDYHYHIIPMHLSSRFGGPLSDDKPVAWALDGYPVYGYVEPDGSARQALDSNGGHDVGSGWGYHYHAVGNNTVDATHPYGTPQSPYTMTSFRGTVVNFGGQVDGQPEVGSIRASGTGGYTAQAVAGASFGANAYKNPVALTTDGSGNLIEDTAPGAVASADNYRLRVTISGTTYDECWRINRNANPKTLTITWRLPGATTTTTYTPNSNNPAAVARLAAYPMAAWSEAKLPDTGQTLDATATFGEDSDYTINAPALTDNADGTVTDTQTGLMWQKVDAGEMTWASAVANSPAQTTGGYSDWRLPTPAELFSIFNHNNNPALDLAKFPNTNNAEYWWTSDIYGADATKVWCTNAGGGLGPKPVTETISAGGTLRYCARYVRGGKPNNGHNYQYNGDGTITDLDTGLMWTQLPAAPMNWNAALNYAENLSLGGYNDWRLPNVKELQTLTDITLATASSTAGIKPCVNRTMFSASLTTCTTTAGGTTITCADTAGLIPGMVLVDPVSAAGSYLPAATPPVVQSVTNSTTFTVTSGTGINPGSGLTFRALVPPTAYWTSTAQKSGTPTSAWLVEMGINNSVPAPNGPPRGSQGIISYEVFSSTYPVFAVRTTSVAAQIGVAQGANTLTDGVSTVGFAGAGSKAFTVTNHGVTSLTLAAITIDGTNAANFALVGAPPNPTTLAPNASATFNVQFSAASAGTYSAALHIASSDPAVGAAFDVNVGGTIPVIGNVATNPVVPSTGDTPYVTAKVTPSSGTAISQVQLTYSYGTQTTATAYRETFANGSFAAGSGASFQLPSLNGWTATAIRAPGDVKLRGGTANNTVPVVLTNCTTNGTTTVTCASTAGLWPNMPVSGTNIAANTTIAQVNSATAFTLSTAAAGSGSGLTLTAAGATLTGCSLATSPAVNTASTAGLAVGMGISGSGLSTNPPNPTVASIGSATQFNLSSTTVTAVPSTLTASGSGAEFSSGTANFADSMFATTNPVNASGTVFTSGSTTTDYVEFSVRTADLVSNNGWQFQIAPDGTNYTTRLTETFATSSATNCTLNNGNNQVSGSTTVLCANTSGLTVGNAVQGNAVSLACGITQNSTTITCANTTGLAVGMFITGTNAAGVPANTRVTAVTQNVSFTVNNAPTGTTGSFTLLANYFAANTTISAIAANTSFTVNNAVFYSGSGVTVSSINHGFRKMHYDLLSGDLTATMKMRFQFSGYNPAGGGGNPARPPSCDIDDISVVLTTGVAPVTVAMLDDGLHGDGVAGDGIYGVQLPSFAAGTAVSYSIAATDSSSTVTTLGSAGSYSVTPPLSITTASTLPGGLTSAPYTQTLAAVGGSGTGYTWSITGGSLPPGVTLEPNGGFSGTPATATTSSFTAAVTDSAGHTSSKAFSLTVKAPPNIVIIVTDDQGWADVGYHTANGQVPIQTPTMDSFATSGIRMERFYATTVCSVTRATLLTGRNAIRTSVNNERGLSLSEHLMPQTFKTAGYQTHMVGKWHLGGPDKNLSYTTVNGVNTRIIQEGSEYHPQNRGWDSHYGQFSGAIDYFTHWSAEALMPDKPDWWLNGVQADGASEHQDSQGHGGWSPDLLADRAVSHIQNRDPNKPLLLYVAFNSIHGPVSAPPDLLAKYSSIADANRRTIAAAVDGMDAAMGRVLAALDTAGLTNNTLVLWFGDNGGDTTKGSLNLPLRGTKGDSYEGGMREPAGIRWPGVLPAGIVSHQYVWVGDVFPTICAAAGVTLQNANDKPLDGVNLWPALLAANNSSTTATRGPALVTVSATPIAIDKFTDPVNGGTKDFKLIRNHVGNTFPVELYNLTDDPQETTDLSANAAFSTIVTTLTSAITAITALDYPPYIGPPLITNSVAQGGTIELYAPFTSYKAPTVQWRKNGATLANGGSISGATSATQVTDSTGALVTGAYTAKLTISGATLSDAGIYDVVISNAGGSSRSAAGTLSVEVSAPVLNALAAYTNGFTQTISWAPVPTATGYTVQASTVADFSASVATQTVTATSAAFTGLLSGTAYYFRATATDGVTTSAYSNIVSTTGDMDNPALAITSPSSGFGTTQNTVNVQGTAGDAISGIASVTVNGVAAGTSDSYAHWTAMVPLTVGPNTITVIATDAAGNPNTVSVTGTYTPLVPVIANVTTAPASPTYLDPTWVTAQVQPGAGATLSQVQLLYDLGTPVTTKVFQETFAIASSNNWNGSGANYAWTTAGGNNVRQAVSASNRTTPVAVSNCTTTNGSATVTCSSTANLWPGMVITGANIPAGTRIAVSPAAFAATTFTLTNNATADGAGLSLTACGVTLTNCNTTGATSTPFAVTCDNTTGLVANMSLSGTGLGNNATVASVTDITHFNLNAAPTTTGSGLTITASGAAAEFNGGTTSLTGSAFTTTNAINTTGNAGYVEFYVQTRDLAAPATTVNVTGVVTSGSAVVTGTATASLGVGMLVSGTGIPAGTSIASIDSGSQFTMSAAATNSATGAATAVTAINNNQWRFQVSSDGGATWTTRLSEDWDSSTVSLASVVTNSAGAAAGSTTVTCTSTGSLAAGRTVAGPVVYSAVSCGTTSGQSTVACTDTTGLVAGMFVSGTGIPNNTRIGAVTTNTSFTLVTGTAATPVNATATGSTPVAATYFAPNSTVSSITNGTAFVINTPAYVNTAASPFAATATTINHGFQLYHYDLSDAELGTNTKLRFQFAGYTPVLPTAKPRVNVDDIVVATTTAPPTVAVTMYDDGLHGDGAAGDGTYGAQVPVQAGGTTVSYRVSATDSSSVTITSSSASFTVNPYLTDATITNAEFLTIPTDTGVTLSVGLASDQDAYVQYGTTPGSYPNATTPATFAVATGPMRIALTGLQPDTKYYYRLRHRPAGSSGAYAARGERSFRTSRPRGASFVFTVTADPHLDFNTDATLLTRAMSNLAADQPDFHIDLGDIFMTDKMADTVAGVPAQYGGGPVSQTSVNLRASIFRNFFELACHSVPYFYTLGNHEAEYGYLFNAAADKQNNIPAWNLKARKAYYPAPTPNLFYTGNGTPKDYNGGTLGLLEDYYAWEWGDALFIVLDPFWNTTTNPNSANDAWQWTLGKPQYDWLKATLQNSSARYKFVFMHHIVGGTPTLADGSTPNVAARGGVEVAAYYEWGGKNADGSDGFPARRSGWDMPIHTLLVANHVNAVFHGHDHLYGYQTLDGLVYLECPQPGTANYTTLGSAADGKYTQGVLLPNSGHIRVTIDPNQALAEYVRSYRPSDENATTHNRDVSHSFTMSPHLSGDASLVSLGLSHGVVLSPNFISTTYAYGASVPNSTTALTVTPALADSTASVKVNGVAIASGSASAPISLNVGANAIQAVVTAEDGTTKTYAVTVTRQATMDNWRQTWYATTANGGAAADDADPYETGIPNLAVYGLFGPNQNPATAQAAQLPQPQLSSGNYTFTFAEPPGVTGLSYGAEWSADLQSWTPVSDSGSGNLHMFNVPTGPNTKLFIRLKVTR